MIIRICCIIRETHDNINIQRQMKKYDLNATPNLTIVEEDIHMEEIFRDKMVKRSEENLEWFHAILISFDFYAALVFTTWVDHCTPLSVEALGLYYYVTLELDGGLILERGFVLQQGYLGSLELEGFTIKGNSLDCPSEVWQKHSEFLLFIYGGNCVQNWIFHLFAYLEFCWFFVSEKAKSWTFYYYFSLRFFYFLYISSLQSVWFLFCLLLFLWIVINRFLFLQI